jgi:hypothetical protein
MPEKNCFREYGIIIGQNLLGEWVVSCSWGRIGGRQRAKATYFGSKSLCEKVNQAPIGGPSG